MGIKRKILSLTLGILAACLLLGGVACNDATGNNPNSSFQHSYSEWENLEMPTCESNGYNVAVCNKCGDKKYQILEANGHVWGDAYLLETSTCKNGDKKLYTCSVCGLSKYVEEEITADHNYKSGACLDCGTLKYSEGLKYALNADNESYTVQSMGDCKDETLVIPETYLGLPVTAMDVGFLYECDFVKSVVISNNITDVAIWGSSVECVKLGDSVENIYFGNTLDVSVTNLKEISVSNNNPFYKAIDGNLYSKDGSKLVKYAIGKNESYFAIPKIVNEIEMYAFHKAISLSEINIPETVTKIGDAAFSECLSLKKVTIPTSIENMGVDVFADCISLVKAEINSRLDANELEYQGPYYGCFRGCSSLTDISFGENMKAIQDMMFARCKSLSNILIPEGVIGVGASAFEYCTDLSYVNIPTSVTQIGSSAFGNCTSLETIIIPENVTDLGARAFENCATLEEVYIGDSVKRVYDNTFANCAKLRKVVIGDGVTDIDQSAFNGANALEYLEIGDSLACIKNVFRGLKNIVIGDSVKTIGDGVFRWCADLANIYVKGTKEEWETLSIGKNNTYLDKAKIYYYSETQPTTEGNFWCDDAAGDNVIIW